jgi:hypothetical protein
MEANIMKKISFNLVLLVLTVIWLIVFLALLIVPVDAAGPGLTQNTVTTQSTHIVYIPAVCVYQCSEWWYCAVVGPPPLPHGG